MWRCDELPERARFADNRGQLCPRGHQHPYIRRAEDPRFDGLHDEDALKQPAIDHRHAEKRMVQILASLLEILEARMHRRIGDTLRPQLLGHEAGQSFGEAHPNSADALGPKPNRDGQHEIGAIRLQQVDRADVRFEPLLNQVDDVGQRLGGVAALGDQPADFLEGPEQRPFVGGRRRQHDRGPEQECCLEGRTKCPATACDRGREADIFVVYTPQAYINV
jgi:hypothetical protein